MEPSAELEAVVRRWFAAWNARDFETVINLCTEDSGVLYIGSDPDEWWSDLDTIRGIAIAQLREHDDIELRFELDHVEAFQEGTVGWGACRVSALGSADMKFPMRFTAVLHLEHGIWRFVQSHFSVGVENEEALGVELTTTIENLALAVTEERPDLTATVAPDGTVTIAFSDIEGSTDLAERLGDRQWLDLLRWHDRIVEACAARERGIVVKSMGDGHMLAFSSANRALQCATFIQRALQESYNGETLRVRIGVHSGEVLRHADDFYGHHVNVAARVAGAASGTEILASSLVHELTRSLGAFEFAEPRTVRLRGISGEHQLYPLMWQASS
jgi:class 3 adenylate cyclase/ketosteroid isomerase-like protein